MVFKKRKTIGVFEVIGSESAIMPEDVEKVLSQVLEALNQETKVTIDFGRIKTVITAFLNTAVGKLYKDYTSEQLNAYLEIKGLSSDDIQLLNKVILRAKDFYRDQEGFGKAVENSGIDK